MDRDRLRSLPAYVGLSDKLALENKIGEKAIGLLAFYSLGADALAIWSRSEASTDDPHCLVFKKGDLNAVLDPDGEPAVPSFLSTLRQGTVVELRGMPAHIARYLTREKVREHLAKLYRERLRRAPSRMIVLEGKRSDHVTAQTFKGTPFWRRELLTRYGPIELQLHILPSPSDRRIEVFCKGQRVCDIDNLDESFREFPWNTGQVHGVISADFLKPTTGRAGFASNKAFMTCVDQLRSVKLELQEAVKEEAQTYKAEQDRKMQSDLNLSFLRALLQLRTQGWSGIEALVRSRSGVDKGTTVESGRGVKLQRRGRRPGREGIRRQVLGNGEDPAASGTGVNFDQQVFDDQEAHLRSRFDSQQALIVINQNHPDYREEYPDQRRRYQYFHLLLAKELTLYNWGKERPNALLEHLVELDTTARRYRSTKELL